MKYVVVGAGYTGRRVVELLPATDTIVLSRSARGRSARDRSSTEHALDLDGTDVTLPRLPASHALLYTVPPARDAADDRRLHKLLECLERPPARIVYISTSGVYGDRGGERVDEAVETRPATDRARRRVVAESLLREWCGARSVALFILRVPGIYGPGRLMLERIRAREPMLLESEANPGNRIHVDDLARCCVAALTRDVPAGIYNVGDGDGRSSTWFAKTVARLAGLPPPPEIPRAQAMEKMSATRLSFLAESRRLDTTKMRDALGVVPEYADAEAGIRASLAADGLLV